MIGGDDIWSSARRRLHDPKGIAVRTMIPGDSSVQLPARVSFSAMFHGNDERERILVDGLRWRLRPQYELVTGRSGTDRLTAVGTDERAG